MLGVIAGEIIVGLSRAQIARPAAAPSVCTSVAATCRFSVNDDRASHTVSEFAQVLRNHPIPWRFFAPRVSWNPHWLVTCFHVDSQTDKC